MKSYVYIVFGASGSGKSTLFHSIRNSDIIHSINTKLTSRAKRDYDEDEIETSNIETIKSQKYVYSRYGNLYAINEQNIKEAIKNKINHFIVCNDTATINKMIKDFKDVIKVIFLSYDAPKKTIAGIIKTRNISDDELNLRIQKIDILYEEFVVNRELFDHVIINKYGSPPNQMMHHLRRILVTDIGQSAFGFSNIQNEMLNIYNKISDLETAVVNSNITLKAESEVDYVFIVMPMIEENPELIDVLNAIKRACISTGKKSERVDDYIHKNEVTEKMLGSIKSAKYVIIDLTYSRPNVYYELGYAHAYDKDVIITAKKGTTPHFNIRNRSILFYETLAELEDVLVKRIKKYDKEEYIGSNI